MFPLRRAARLSTLIRAVQKQPVRFAHGDKNLYNTPWGDMIEHPINNLGKVINNHPSEAKDMFRGGNIPEKTYSGAVALMFMVGLVGMTTFFVSALKLTTHAQDEHQLKMATLSPMLQQAEFLDPSYHRMLAGLAPTSARAALTKKDE